MNEILGPRLEDLKVGDSVVVSWGGAFQKKRVSRIEKVLKRHLVVDGVKYHKDGFGRRVGGTGFWVDSITPATPTLLAEIEYERKLNVVMACDWKKATETEINKVYETVAGICNRLGEKG